MKCCLQIVGMRLNQGGFLPLAPSPRHEVDLRELYKKATKSLHGWIYPTNMFSCSPQAFENHTFITQPISCKQLTGISDVGSAIAKLLNPFVSATIIWELGPGNWGSKMLWHLSLGRKRSLCQRQNRCPTNRVPRCLPKQRPRQR